MSSAAVASEAKGHESHRRAGLRERLRAATAEDHERLDRQLSTLDLQDLGGYREFLEVNAAALLPLEAALEQSAVAGSFPDWPERSRSAAILADLMAVGGFALPLPPLATLDAGGVLGTMYVLEGSRLGARYLLKTVAQSSNPIVRGATAYLAHGAGAHPWQGFLAQLEAFDLTPQDEASAVDAARDAFALFARAMRVAA